MARTLILAEKPAVARDLARALNVPATGNGSFTGDRYVVTWCIGHLIELAEPAEYDAAYKRWSLTNLPILPAEFKLRPIRGSTRQWQVVRELLRSRDFTSVVNACDAGREGELIFRLCYALSGSRLPIQRLWISSLTPQAIERGFRELRPGRDYDALAAAARCRAQADWLVGMNATRAVTLWRRSGGGDALCSLGRVQTPTLGILVRREQEITTFVPRDYFEIQASLTPEAGADKKAPPFKALWQHAGKRRIAARAHADFIRTRDEQAPPPWVEHVETKEVREPPPLLFDLGALQQTANRRFGWSAQRTLGIAQSLYESHKLITYPRTDSRYLSTDLRAQMPKHFAALRDHAAYQPFVEPLLAGPLPPSKRIFQDHKVTDHHAIIPTAVALTAARYAGLSREEQQLYDLVARRFIGIFHPDAVFAQTKVTVRVDAKPGEPPPELPGPPVVAVAKPAGKPDEDFVTKVPPPPDRYHTQGRVRLQAGWQAVAGLDEARSANRRPDAADDGDDEDDANQALPPLRVGDRLDARLETLTKKTKPPPRYTDASLLAAMEGAGKKLDDEALRQAMKDAGLGTPATRAAVIETLLDRGYVERGGKLLLPTPFGVDLIERLPAPGLASPELTGQWEARLGRIARSEDDAPAFMADIAAYVRDLVGRVKASPPPAAISAPPAAARTGRTGRTARSGTRTRAAAGAGDVTPKRTRAKSPGRSFAKSPRARRSSDADEASALDQAVPARTTRRKAPARKTAAESSAEPRRAAAPRTKKATTRAPKKAAAPKRSSRLPAAASSEPPAPKTRRTKASSVTHAPPPVAPAPVRPARAPRAAEHPPDLSGRPSAGTPVTPGLRCPRCGAGWLIWGRRAWGCSNFRACAYVVPFADGGDPLDIGGLRQRVLADSSAGRGS